MKNQRNNSASKSFFADVATDLLMFNICQFSVFFILNSVLIDGGQPSVFLFLINIGVTVIVSFCYVVLRLIMKTSGSEVKLMTRAFFIFVFAELAASMFLRNFSLFGVLEHKGSFAQLRDITFSTAWLISAAAFFVIKTKIGLAIRKK